MTFALTSGSAAASAASPSASRFFFFFSFLAALSPSAAAAAPSASGSAAAAALSFCSRACQGGGEGCVRGTHWLRAVREVQNRVEVCMHAPEGWQAALLAGCPVHPPPGNEALGCSSGLARAEPVTQPAL